MIQYAVMSVEVGARKPRVCGDDPLYQQCTAMRPGVNPACAGMIRNLLPGDMLLSE